MAEYSVSTDALCVAGDDFYALAAEFDAVCGRLKAVLAELPEDMSELRKRLAGAGEDVCEASQKARGFGRALWEISEIYSRAERDAFAGRDRGCPGQAGTQKAAHPPPIREPSGAALFGGVVMPEWLRAASLKYEQARLSEAYKAPRLT